MKDKFVKVEILKGVSNGKYSLAIQSKKSGRRVAGEKPWGGGRTVHSYEVNAKELIDAIQSNAYEREDPQ